MARKTETAEKETAQDKRSESNAENGLIYDQWVYPQPISDLKAYKDSGRIDAAAPRMVHQLYWPDGHYEACEEEIDILIAGCGPNAAARYAFEHPKANVVGIDISDAAIAHAESLQEKHDLKNLTLKKLSLENVGELKEKFDLIEVVGVLNHLDNPVSTTKELKKLLKPNGVMVVMLYGIYGRPGAYMLQKLFKEVGLGHSEEDIETVRRTIGLLDENHPVHMFNRTTFDVQFDAGLVDAYLRGVDPTCDVEGCLQFAKDVGMNFMGWIDNFNYHPDGQIPPTHPLYKPVMAMPKEEMWKAMELFNGTMKKHTFYMCLNDRDAKTYAIDFEGNAFLDYVPIRRINKFEKPDPQQNKQAMIQRVPFKAVPLSDVQLALYANTDGQRTIREIIKETGLQGDEENVHGLARNFYHSLWRIGYAMYKIPSVDTKKTKKK